MDEDFKEKYRPNEKEKEKLAEARELFSDLKENPPPKIPGKSTGKPKYIELDAKKNKGKGGSHG